MSNANTSTAMFNKYVASDDQKDDTKQLQRTTEWHVSRASKIGASEIYDFIHNPRLFQKRKTTAPDGLVCSDFRRNKTATKPPKSNNYMHMCCNFGTVFEEVAAKYLSSMYEAKGFKFMELPSIQHPTVPTIAASADGLVVNDKTGEVRTIEIKCPIFRTCTTLPDKYMFQMQQQLMCIPEATSCDYHAFQFRVCKWFDSGTPVFNRYYHRAPAAKYPPVQQKDIIMCGIIEVLDGKAKDYGAYRINPVTKKPYYHMAKFADLGDPSKYKVHILNRRCDTCDELYSVLSDRKSSMFCFTLLRHTQVNVVPDEAIQGTILMGVKRKNEELRETLRLAEKSVQEWIERCKDKQ